MKINIEQFESDFKGVKSPLQSRLAQVKLYEFDLSDYAARQIELSQTETYASFTKACDLNAQKNGLRSPGFWVGFYDALIGANWDLEGLALSNSLGETRSVMQFLPASCNKISANLIFKIALAQLGSLYDVILLNGDHTSNEKAESIVKDAVSAAEADGRNVWVISHGMAARSFSIPQIDTVLLTYDGGAMGSTLQKLSRALTAGPEEKVGKIVSISIDPNREDKVAGVILDAAVNFSEEHGVDLNEALRRAWATFPLFTLDETGASLPIKEDDYIERAMKLNSVRALAVNRSRLFTLDGDVAIDLANEIIQAMNITNRAGQKDAYAPRGQRFVDPRQSRERETVDPDLHQRAVNCLNEQLNAFAQNLDLLVYFVDTDKPQLNGILTEAETDFEATGDFIEITGVAPRTVRRFIEERLIDRKWADATLLRARVEARAN